MYINTWSLYLMSAINGFGQALIWTGSGSYYASNSDEKTTGKMSSLYWSIQQTWQMVGAIFLFVVFRFTDKDIDQSTIRILYTGFTIVAFLGFLVLTFLRPPTKITCGTDTPRRPHMENILAPFKLSLTKNMIILTVPFMYAGIEVTFWSGIYSTFLAFTNTFNFSDNTLLAYNAFAVGLGEIVGGMLVGIYGERTIKYGWHPITTLSTVETLITCILIFINIPAQSPLHKTDEISIISPNVPIALLCSALLGFSDCCWNTQITSKLAIMYKNNSSVAFAVFNFYFALAASVSFFYGSLLDLRWQLAIIVIAVSVSSIYFYTVERRSKNTVAPCNISSTPRKLTRENETKM